ncbi:MAG: glycoside hydrolase family 3 N-terminal domain-containing protein [Gemmatimonas sp.]
MSIRRDLAQLLVPVVRWTPGRGYAEERPRIDAALELGVGGFQLIGGEQDVVRSLAKELQIKSKHRLLIAADLERGAGQQFSGATGLPPLAAIVALGDIESLRRAARLTAREARTMGVNWNLAPVCDLDVLAENPVVGTRSMGRDPRAVATLVTAWIEACQAEGVLACAKHFPGIGRVTSDPAVRLPVVGFAADQLKDQDLQPFRAAIAAGVASMMTAHVAFTSLDSSGAPATLSREMLQWLLRQQLKYDNLIVSDSLTMAGAVVGHDIAQAAVLALRAGCDVLLDPGELESTLDALERAASDGTLEPERIRQAMRRRLKWAQWASPPNDWRRPSGADTAWGALLADRVLRVVNEPLPTLGTVSEVVIVDDDVDVQSTMVATVALSEALRAGGHDARDATEPTVASGGPLIIGLFSDYRSMKSRATLLPSTVERVRALVEQARAFQRETIVVGCGDPRFAAQLPLVVPTLVAWSGDRVMQQAAARALLKTRKS